MLQRARLLLALFLALTAVLAGCGTGAGGATRTGYHVGNLAPDFTLFNLEGQQVSLHDLQGRPVLVNFWATD